MQITLNTGRKINLARLEQWYTYAGLLAGLPYRHGNERIVKEAIEAAASKSFEGLIPYVIPPRVTPIEAPRASAALLAKIGGTAEQFDESQKNRNYERLPAVTCIGVFDSDGFQQPAPELFSRMTLVWFQHEFALPVEPQVFAQIQALDWEAHAKDWEW